MADSTNVDGILPIENIDLNQSRYKFNSLVFPNDLGMSDNDHYMIININVPTRTINDNVAGSYESYFSPLNPIERSKVDRLRYGPSGPTVPIGDIGSNNGNSAFFSLPRRTRRIAESIALHMPSPLIFNTQNAYEEVSLTNIGFKLGIGTSKAVQYLAGLLNNRVAGTLAAGVGRVLSAAGGQYVGLASKILQSPINPAVEILFANTLVRQFTIEVLMAPRNENESKTMENIIRTMKFHGAPEINDTLGLFWIPPAEFDITFFNKGKENLHILRINTCVLERIEIDYSPTGVYSTFTNGSPVAVRMSLGFKELEPIHKKRVTQGF